VINGYRHEPLDIDDGFCAPGDKQEIRDWRKKAQAAEQQNAELAKQLKSATMEALHRTEDCEAANKRTIIAEKKNAELRSELSAVKRGAVRDWFDTNKDEAVKVIGDLNGLLEKENAELKESWNEAHDLIDQHVADLKEAASKCRNHEATIAKLKQTSIQQPTTRSEIDHYKQRADKAEQRIKDLEWQVKRWEDKEADRGHDCYAMEERAKVAETENAELVEAGRTLVERNAQLEKACALLERSSELSLEENAELRAEVERLRVLCEPVPQSSLDWLLAQCVDSDVPGLSDSVQGLLAAARRAEQQNADHEATIARLEAVRETWKEAEKDFWRRDKERDRVHAQLNRYIDEEKARADALTQRVEEAVPVVGAMAGEDCESFCGQSELPHEDGECYPSLARAWLTARESKIGTVADENADEGRARLQPEVARAADAATVTSREKCSRNCCTPGGCLSADDPQTGGE
jgi:hypothetical protein